jgi:hypothetical protein
VRVHWMLCRDLSEGTPAQYAAHHRQAEFLLSMAADLRAAYTATMQVLMILHV